MTKFLKLNLQHFAEQGDGGSEGVDGADNLDAADNDQKDNQSEEIVQGEGKTFTQAELEQIIADRLAREKRKQEAEANKLKEAEEKKRLEEQGEYKTLLEKAQEELAKKEAEIELRDRKEAIRTKLAEKGLDANVITTHAKYVEGLVSGGAEIEDAVEEVYNDFIKTATPKYQEPSAGFGTRKEPEAKSDEDYGRELFKRIRG